MTFKTSLFALSFLTLTAAVGLAACERTAPPAPVVQLGKNVDSPAGTVTVHQGDTLYDISQRFNLPLQDIVTVNRIAPPYTISNGQRLKLPAPRKYNVQSRDSLYRISRMYGVSVTDLVRANKLQSPYTLEPGQELRIPSRVQKQYAYVDDQKVAVRNTPITKPSTRPSATSKPTPKQTVSYGGAGDFAWPLQGRVISTYGPKAKGLHNDGVNIAAPRGARVGAAKNGQIVYVGNALEGFGNLVIVRHDNGWVTAYAHMDRVSVKRGQRVSRGETLGTVGSTGRVDSPQLHFEIRRGSEALNPQKYLA